jgi:hypothetical protein
MNDLHEDERRGVHAETLLNDELLKSAFETLRSEYLKAWEESKYNATDDRERLWQARQIVGKVETHLKTIIQDGRLARAQLNRDLAPKLKRA